MAKPRSETRDRLGEAQYRLVMRLPGQLDRARRRVAQLENAARRLGLHDLVEGA
jgi:hypothetical protein